LYKPDNNEEIMCIKSCDRCNSIENVMSSSPLKDDPMQEYRRHNCSEHKERIWPRFLGVINMEWIYGYQESCNNTGSTTIVKKGCKPVNGINRYNASNDSG
jgi:hypothetical protein